MYSGSSIIKNDFLYFAAVIALLVWQIADDATTAEMKAQGVTNYVSGFDKLWSWFGWSNQTLSVFMLWAITVYLVQQRKPYIITLIPALFMTMVVTDFLLVSPTTLGWSYLPSLIAAGIVTLLALIQFIRWHSRTQTK